jgi:hypothetical protein
LTVMKPAWLTTSGASGRTTRESCWASCTHM